MDKKKTPTLSELMFPSMCRYKNEVDFIDKLVSIFAIINLKEGEKLRNFEKDVLNYYVRYGYSRTTKKLITEELGKSPATITQATFYLKKLGFVVDSKTNFSDKHLCEDLQSISDALLKGNKHILAIGLKRK